MKHKTVILVIISVLWFICADFNTALGTSSNGNMFYVKKSTQVENGHVESVLSNVGASLKSQFNKLGWACIEFSDSSNLSTRVATIKNNNAIKKVIPRAIPKLFETPNDTYLDLQWYYYNDGSITGSVEDADVDITEAWDYSTGSSSTRIGILDTGIPTALYHGSGWQLNHPDLEDNTRIILGWEDWIESKRWRDMVGHGSFITGIIGASTNNSSGIAGIDRNAELYISQVAIYQSSYPYTQFTTDLQGAIIDAVDNDCDILNISWGSYDDDFGDYLEDAIEYAYDNDVLIVCAAGNESLSNDAVWPAKFAFNGNIDGTSHSGIENGYSNVISVGASNFKDKVANYSDYGTKITFIAPGGEADGNPGGTGEGDESADFSTFPTYPLNSPFNFDMGNSQGYIYWTGTSFAAPIVVGTAALVKDVFPNASASDIKDILISSCEEVGGYSYDQNGRSDTSGYGRINALYAVAPPSAPQNISLSGGSGQHPTISWDPNPEPDVETYRIYRNVRWDRYTQTGWQYQGSTSQTQWTDQNFLIGSPIATAYYKVKARDYSNQNSSYSGTVSAVGAPGISKDQQFETASIDAIPEAYGVSENYPNPFNPSTTIHYQLPEQSQVHIAVYTVAGSKVADLVQSIQAPGYYVVTWHGTNMNSQQVATGVYLYHVSIQSRESGEHYNRTHKMLLVK